MLVSSLHCGGHVKWMGVLLEVHVVWFLILLGCWGQVSFTCVLALRLCLAISCSLPSLPFLVSVRYNVSFPVPLFFFFQCDGARWLLLAGLSWLAYMYVLSSCACGSTIFPGTPSPSSSVVDKLNTAMPTKVMTSMVVSLTHVQEHHSTL